MITSVTNASLSAPAAGVARFGCHTLIPSRPRPHAHRRSSGALTVTATLAPEQGAVLASVGLVGIVHQWMSISVVQARKKYGVPYPALYAEGASENANNFNCVQRGHQNTLEALPLFLISQLLLASLYPLTAAGLIAFWTLGRIIYFLGYAKGDPNKRLPGAIICNLTQLGSWLALGYIGGRAFLKI